MHPLIQHFDNVELPDCQPVAATQFHRGPVDPTTFSQSLDSAYQEVVYWRGNSFDVPRGSVGKCFVCELARLFCAVGEGTALLLKLHLLHVLFCYRDHLMPRTILLI